MNKSFAALTAALSLLALSGCVVVPAGPPPQPVYYGTPYPAAHIYVGGGYHRW